MNEDMSKYQPLFSELRKAQSTEELLEQIEQALEDYDDLWETKRAKDASDLVRAKAFNLRIHLSKFFASLATGSYADYRHRWAAEIEGISDDIVSKISSATRYANDRFYTDLLHGHYTPTDRLKRQKYSPGFIAATQEPETKAKVTAYLKGLSAIRDVGVLGQLFDKQLTLD